MRPKPVLVAGALLALVFGLLLLLAPAQMLGQFGLVSNPAAVVLSRDLGVVLLAIAAMDWMARDAAAGPALNAILWANLLVQGLETIVDSYHVATSQIAATGVGGIAIHVVLGIAFAMALWKPSPASGQA